MLEGSARWVFYVAIVVIAFSFLTGSESNPNKFIKKYRKPKLLWILPWLIPAMVSSLSGRWSGVGHEGASFMGGSTSTWEVALVSFIGALCVAWIVDKRHGALETTFPLVAVVIVVIIIALFNSRLGDQIVRYRDELFIFVPGFVLLARVLVDSGISSTQWAQMSKFRFERLYVSIAFLMSIAFAIRIDGLETVGAWYHLGYFTGVIQTVKDGGILLWDTPSQYGFLSLLLPSIIPGLSPISSLLTIQALLLLIVSVVGLVAIRNSLKTPTWFLFGIVFLILLNLIDPELIGPQPFPSSSVMRFGPSTILLAWLSMRQEFSSRRHLWSVFGGLLAAIGSLWSFESFFYVVLILVGMTLGESNSFRRLLSPSAEIRYLLRVCLVGVAIAIVLYSLFVYLRVAELPSWRWYLLASSRYAAGHGALPTDLFGAIWIFLLGIVALLVLSYRGSQHLRSCTGSSLGALCGWLTYYFGRSHSSNIMVLVPLIFLAIVLPVGHALTHLRSLTKSTKQITITERFKGRELSPLVAPALAVVVLLGSIASASILANPRIPSVAARYRPLPLAPRFEYLEIQELNELLRAVEIKKLPVAYQGNLGMLPALASDVAVQLDLDGTWLPLPLALLEEPIPTSARQLMIERTFERSNESGYLIWHVSNSIAGRGEAWLEDLGRSHDCQLIGSSENWHIYECVTLTE